MRKLVSVFQHRYGKDYLYLPLSRCVCIFDTIGNDDYVSSFCIRYVCSFSGMCKDCPYLL